MGHKFKQTVRHRMKRTGEKYTAAAAALRSDPTEYDQEKGRMISAKRKARDANPPP